VDISLKENEPILVSGEWIDMAYTLDNHVNASAEDFGKTFDHLSTGSEYLKKVTVNVKTFVTNYPIGLMGIDGIIGMSPCHDGLNEYSFAHNLVNLDNVDPNNKTFINSIEWNLS
jgi:hypothetical protein